MILSCTSGAADYLAACKTLGSWAQFPILRPAVRRRKRTAARQKRWCSAYASGVELQPKKLRAEPPQLPYRRCERNATTTARRRGGSSINNDATKGRGRARPTKSRRRGDARLGRRRAGARARSYWKSESPGRNQYSAAGPREPAGRHEHNRRTTLSTRRHVDHRGPHLTKARRHFDSRRNPKAEHDPFIE